MDGAPRRACGCQSCRHKFGPPEARRAKRLAFVARQGTSPMETFPEYLRRVGDDYQASYGDDEESPTKRDYYDAAERIEELEAALRFIVNDVPAPGEDAELTTKGYNRACAALNKERP
jgi:hypothetical protein